MSEIIEKTGETGENTTATGAGENTTTEKTYTAAEVNSIVESRIARERKNLPSDVDLKEFREYKKNQKTDAERYAEQAAELQAAKSELAMIKNQQATTSAGCKPEFAEFVADKVAKMGGDFAKSLQEYKAKNPQYFSDGVVRKFATSPTLSGGTNEKQSGNDMINNGLRSLFKTGG